MAKNRHWILGGDEYGNGPYTRTYRSDITMVRGWFGGYGSGSQHIILLGVSKTPIDLYPFMANKQPPDMEAEALAMTGKTLGTLIDDHVKNCLSDPAVIRDIDKNRHSCPNADFQNKYHAKVKKYERDVAQQVEQEVDRIIAQRTQNGTL